MGKKARAKLREVASVEGEVPVVGMREPCPCGSGRRYKACHGKEANAAEAAPVRPFAGLAFECDLIAMRELVPSATAPMTMTDGRVVTL